MILILQNQLKLLMKNNEVVGEDVNVLQEDTQQIEVTTPVTTQEPAAGW